MENTLNAPVETQGVEYWEKELEYLENAMQGVQTAYAILKANHDFCNSKLKELTTEREEVD